MIAFLTGRLAFKAPTHLTLDVQGVGYEVHIPLSTYYALPNLDEVTALNIHTHLREDAIQLFGFLSQYEKESFLLLTTVSGIGPKLALSVLSSLPVADLVRAIQTEDVDKLATVPGIGKKSAGRIALELKDKVGRIQPGTVQATASDVPGVDGPYEDALSALVNLGYRPQDAREALKRVTKAAANPIILKDLIREGLKELARG
ncbi:MAG TPA: Holliday junction branch migration protein RuvA [Nitrospiraceae bacterium]|nr:Holliday junction branch migration protein RuvA [Nitrospiraceae bacterium]